tara:strand:- start:8414 stop:9127 length:714 start_codon:yes stop_codon:yes gene_type:complete
MKSEKELRKLYDKYIDIKLYRVIPKRDLAKIKREGINPAKDPYEKIKPKVKEFAKLVARLEKKGLVIKIDWGRTVYGAYVMAVTLRDLKINAVDFTPEFKDVKYYLKLQGGAIVSNIKVLTDVVIKERFDLSSKEFKLVKELNRWARSKICDNVVLFVNGSSRSFESAKFQLIQKGGKARKKKYVESTYLKSPFGSFENFRKVIEKEGWRKYSSVLKNKNYYLRVINKIPFKEIKSL